MTEATRALDAEVATKVMGWREVYMTDRDGYERWFGLPPGSHDFEMLPFYSDHIEAAWQVVEKMQKRGLLVVIDSLYLPVRWHVRFGHDFNAEADTVSLAICLAALAAVG